MYVNRRVLKMNSCVNFLSSRLEVTLSKVKTYDYIQDNCDAKAKSSSFLENDTVTVVGRHVKGTLRNF